MQWAWRQESFTKLKFPSWGVWEKKSTQIEKRKCFEMRFERSMKARPCRAFRLR